MPKNHLMIQSVTALHSYYMKQGYNKTNLGVYLVRCNSKNNKQGSIVLPILAPLFDDYTKQLCSSVFEIYTSKKMYTFTVKQYIKASALCIANEIDLNPDNPNIWKTDSYEKSDIIFSFGSAEDCMLFGYDKIINHLACVEYDFDQMMLAFISYGQTTPVTLTALLNA